jgi:hypothetical protein
MSRTTTTAKKLMGRIKRRLDTFEKYSANHCGHEELVDDFLDYREKFLNFMEREIDELARKAGMP